MMDFFTICCHFTDKKKKYLLNESITEITTSWSIMRSNNPFVFSEDAVECLTGSDPAVC